MFFAIFFQRFCTFAESVVSHKRADLDKLLARFSIQLDNPIFWMSQNRCREFLQELRPNKLYKVQLSTFFFFFPFFLLI